MIKRAIVLIALGLAAVVGAPVAALAFGVGLGTGVVPVPTAVPVPGVVDSVVSGVSNVVGGTVSSVAPAPASGEPVFAGPADTVSGAPSASYKAFENLVNDVEQGGGSSAPVVATDVFSGGVDGGVAGVPVFPPVRYVQ